ncbi:MAG: hypothetical protein KatS3mg123_0804 [Burkholderiales bacterium]|nr:MAG: hypothetical protein KatS3mg123_0804 [Burkholderiales bacterium]
MLPIDSLPRAFAAGTVWGWLPCGLVYSVLFTALLSASPVTGALIMLAFGAGTLPNLMAMGWFAGSLKGFLQRPWVRYGAGAVIVAFGIDRAPAAPEPAPRHRRVLPLLAWRCLVEKPCPAGAMIRRGAWLRSAAPLRRPGPGRTCRRGSTAEGSRPPERV